MIITELSLYLHQELALFIKLSNIKQNGNEDEKDFFGRSYADGIDGM